MGATTEAAEHNPMQDALGPAHYQHGGAPRDRRRSAGQRAGRVCGVVDARVGCQARADAARGL